MYIYIYIYIMYIYIYIHILLLEHFRRRAGTCGHMTDSASFQEGAPQGCKATTKTFQEVRPREGILGEGIAQPKADTGWSRPSHTL